MLGLQDISTFLRYNTTSRKVKTVAILIVGGGAYGVKTVIKPYPDERGSLGVDYRRLTTNVEFRNVYRYLNCISC
uniref:Uncharacterized protein n=1 Tax=Pediococcus pentosaceus TaxID=1255 RepID=Q9RHE1_PEDPE|nr:unknown [Pediococcus pentosaceus]